MYYTINLIHLQTRILSIWYNPDCGSDFAVCLRIEDTGLPIIEFSDFSFKYRAQQEPTLQHINLKVRKGEKILITGPSGCGKSTIVHCINGLIPEALPGEMSGKLSVCGLSPEDAGIFGMSRHVGTVLQDTDGQFIGLTVAEDLAFSLENDNQPQEELFRKVDEVAHIVGMEHFLKHAPSELSGGQKQRVSMGGVLVDDVEILLFDEPLANLDPATGKTTVDLIDRICREQDKTVIIIEHRLEDVLYRSRTRRRMNFFAAIFSQRQVSVSRSM